METTGLTWRILKMTTKTGFIELFWSEVKDSPGATYEQIYNALESEYYSAFKRRRYSSYDSFRRRRDEKTN